MNEPIPAAHEVAHKAAFDMLIVALQLAYEQGSMEGVRTLITETAKLQRKLFMQTSNDAHLHGKEGSLHQSIGFQHQFPLLRAKLVSYLADRAEGISRPF